MSRNSRQLGLFLIIALLSYSGCSKDKQTMPVEVWRGRFTTRRFSLAETRTDSVAFTYDNGAYSFNHIDKSTGLCNSAGNAADFGTNSVIFTPNSVGYNMTCDTLRVPRGEFDTFFRSGAGYDSLAILKNDSAALDISYDIRLIRTK
jgi:hypothetical protein